MGDGLCKNGGEEKTFAGNRIRVSIESRRRRGRIGAFQSWQKEPHLTIFKKQS